jgi:hypothetical protein
MGTIRRPVKEEDIRKLIAVRAYELWESHGRPHDDGLSNWRQAEQEIMTCTGNSERPVASGVAQGRPGKAHPQARQTKAMSRKQPVRQPV